MLTKEAEADLTKMEFGKLRQLIDYCLSKEDSLDKKYLSFVTQDTDKLSEYIDILENKRKPQYSPPKRLFLTESESLQTLKNESEKIIADAERKIIDEEKKSKNIVINLKKALTINENLLNELKIKLDALKKEATDFESSVLVSEEIKLNKAEPLSEIQNRLLFWANKLQKVERYSNYKDKKNTSEPKKKNFRVKIEIIEKEILVAYKKSANLNSLKKGEQEKYIALVNKCRATIEREKKRDFNQELENQQKIIDRNYSEKVEDYERSYRKKLKTYKNSLHSRIIERLRSSVANSNFNNLTVQKLNWKLLPTGEISFNKLEEYLQKISKLTDEEFDYEKISKIISLKADKIYCGENEFNGYFVFYFEQKKTAILDCPKRGNAIYIFGSEWKILSRLSKSALLNYHHNKTVRIIHRGEWFTKLKTYIENLS